MTLTTLTTALDLLDEIGPEAVGYAYRNKRNQTLYAVFYNESRNDLESSTEVIAYIPIDRRYSCHSDCVRLLDIALEDEGPYLI